jgi:hypothetical protein
MPSTWTRDVSSNGGHFNVYLGYYNWAKNTMTT